MFQEFHTPEAIARIGQLLNEILIEYYAEPAAQPVTPNRSKSELLEKFREKVPPRTGIGLEAALTLFRQELLPNSVKTWHPLFMNQMFAGSPFPAIIGDYLAGMMNPTLATWEMSPAATIIEKNVSEWMASFLGMRPGASGIFLPGGSLGNFLALAIARNTKLADNIRQKGLADVTRGAILCSEASHYSIANAADLLGIGLEQIFKVATNECDEMLVEDFIAKLHECEARGLKPFVAVATMGTTVTGGFDPLAKIAPICRERGIHLHADAAFGGGISLTSANKLLAGIELADTVIWDAHKWLHVPLTCTVLLVPEASLLKQVFNSKAGYLFHPQEEELPEVEDMGQYTILCGKRFDALKIWLTFKALGADHFREIAEERLQLTYATYRLLQEDPEFEPSYEPRSPIQCFRHIPLAARGATDAYLDAMHRWIRETAKKRQIALFNISLLKGREHFRMILINVLTGIEDLKTLLEQIKELAREYMTLHPLEAQKGSS